MNYSIAVKYGAVAGVIEHPATGRSEKIGLSHHNITIFIIPTGYGVHTVLNIDVSRAGILTANHSFIIAIAYNLDLISFADLNESIILALVSSCKP